MKILKKILIGLGGLFVALVALIAIMSWSSFSFLEENRAFAEQFTQELAERWRIDDVYDLVSIEFIESAATPNGEAFLRELKALGRLEETADFQIGNYYSGTGGTTGEIKFRASFSNAKAVVTVTVVKRDGKVLVQGFNISAPDGVSPQPAEHEA